MSLERLMYLLNRLTNGQPTFDGYQEPRFGTQDTGEPVMPPDRDDNPER